MTRHCRLALYTLSTLFSAAVAMGHELIYERSVGSPYYLRVPVAGVGDVDADGVPDFAFALTENNGAVLVTSGASKLSIYTLLGDATAWGLGRFMTTIGDVDLDGIGDLAVAYGNGVRVFGLGTGQALYTIANQGPFQDLFGSTMTGLGDLDGDGRADFAVGASQYYFTGSTLHVFGPGFVRIYSGGSGSLIRQISGLPNEFGFGNSIANGGDLDGDGKDDVLVSQGGVSNTGAVRAYSGVSGALISSVPHLEAGGAILVSLGDVDADGVVDFALGHYNRVAVISGTTGSTLHSRAGTGVGDRFGSALANVGDVDGDTVSDLLVGAPQKYVCTGYCGPFTGLIAPGYATLLSGRTGQVLETMVGNRYGQRLGSTCSALGDLDGDGKPEFLVVTEGNYSDRPPQVRIYAGRSGFSVPRKYCFAYGNGPSIGSIDFTGTTSIAANQLSLTLAGASPGQLSTLFCGTSATSIQFDFLSSGAPGLLCVGPRVQRVGLPQAISSQGSALVPVDLSPTSPFTVGTTWYFQFAHGASPLYRNTSDCLAVTFTP